MNSLFLFFLNYFHRMDRTRTRFAPLLAAWIAANIDRCPVCLVGGEYAEHRVERCPKMRNVCTRCHGNTGFEFHTVMSCSLRRAFQTNGTCTSCFVNARMMPDLHGEGMGRACTLANIYHYILASYNGEEERFEEWFRFIEEADPQSPNHTNGITRVLLAPEEEKVRNVQQI